MRSRSASASTASPVDDARSWRRSTRWPSGLSTRSSSDLGLARGDTVLAFVNGMGGTPAHRAVRRLQQRREDPGWPGHLDRAVAGRATTSPASRWPGSRSPCFGWTTTWSAGGTLRSTRRRCAGASDFRSADRRAGNPPARRADATLPTRLRRAPGSAREPKGLPMIDTIEAWLRLAADAASRTSVSAHSPRPGHRRRRPRYEHGPRVQRHRGLPRGDRPKGTASTPWPVRLRFFSSIPAASLRPNRAALIFSRLRSSCAAASYLA